MTTLDGISHKDMPAISQLIVTLLGCRVESILQPIRATNIPNPVKIIAEHINMQ